VLCCPKTCLRGWRECQTCANPGTPGSHFLEGSTECRATTVVLSISAVYPVKMNALHDKRTTETCNVSSRTHVFTAYRWRKGKHCPFSCGSYVSRKGILIYYIIPQQRRPRMSCTCKIDLPGQAPIGTGDRRTLCFKTRRRRRCSRSCSTQEKRPARPSAPQRERWRCCAHALPWRKTSSQRRSASSGFFRSCAAEARSRSREKIKVVIIAPAVMTEM